MFQLIYFSNELGEICFNIWRAPYVCDYPPPQKRGGALCLLLKRGRIWCLLMGVRCLTQLKVGVKTSVE